MSKPIRVAVTGAGPCAFRVAAMEKALAAALPSVRFVPTDGAWHLPDIRDVASIAAATVPE